ncbi:MAG TPA: sensor domain-containing protein [Ktedonobacteraceae bacterium]|nr:sensor domain-containing protein [Ktedonobacteraceae bacterium]
MKIYDHPTRKHSIAGTYTFLFLSLPFALLYFIITVTLFSLSLGTMVIWIGLPILLLLFVLLHGFALLECSLVHNLLGIGQPIPRPLESSISLRLRFVRYLQDPLSWTRLIYMLVVKLPLSIVSFTLVLVLPLLSVVLTLFPLAYLLNLFINGILLLNHIPSQTILIPFFIEVHQATFEPLMFARCFLIVPVGVLLWFVSNWLLGGLAHVSGLLAYALLAPEQQAEATFSPFRPQMEATYVPPMTPQSQAARSEMASYD